MKVAFWNCAGTGNLGDDLCHLGAVEYIKRYFRGAPIEAHHLFRLNEKAIKEVNESDYLVIGGGQLLDRTDFLEQLVRAKIKVPYMFVGVGVGSVNDIMPFRDKVKPKFWHVRDRFSASVLRECDVKGEIQEGTDVSVYLGMRACGAEGTRHAGINLKNIHKDRNFIEGLSDELERVIDPVALLAFNSTPRMRVNVDGEQVWISDCDDSWLMRQIKREASDDYEVSTISYVACSDDPLKWVKWMGHLDYMICERYHAVVLAHQFGIPYKAINYHGKVARFLSDVGQQSRIIGSSPEEIVDGLLELRAEAKMIREREEKA